MNGPDPVFIFGHKSHKGPRESNEDTVLSIELPDGRWLLAVADGMGGLADGGLASKAALGAVYQKLSRGSSLVEAVREGNAAVLKEAGQREMGTTLVAAVFTGPRAEVVNVGDSRAYHLDPLGLVQVTLDHTLGQDALREGAVTARDVDSYPMAGALSRYLGAGEQVDVDYFGPFEISERGWLLLCSDGLYRVFPTEEMEPLLLGETDANTAAERLVEGALNREADDNVSIALAFRPGSAPRVPEAILRMGPEPFSKRGRSRRAAAKRKRKRLVLILTMVGVPLLIAIFLVLWRVLGSG